MSRATVAALMLVAGAAAAFGQALTEWHTGRGLPVAVVELTGGDVEHFAALLPPEAAAPAKLGDFPAASVRLPEGLLWSATVPSLLARQAAAELARTLAATGAGAVLALGPASVRELEEPLAALADTPLRAPARTRCVLTEGGIEVRRGAPERVELVLTLPGPADERFSLLPALNSWLQARLTESFAGATVATATEGDCAHLVVAVLAQGEHPRALLRRLRQRLAEVALTSATAQEVERALSACRVELGRALLSGSDAARGLTLRLAFGGTVVGALVVPAVDAASLQALALQVLAGHPGAATVVEQERRPMLEAPTTLENGVVLTTRWIPGEMALVAVALGGMAPEVGEGALQALGSAMTSHGWPSERVTLAGVPVLAVVVPPDSLPEALEKVSGALVSATVPDTGGPAAQLAGAIGLRDKVTAETVSVALALPAEADEGVEAARKFFADLRSGGVRSTTTLANPGRTWTVTADVPTLETAAELPATPGGFLVGELVSDRIGGTPGISIREVAAPGRLYLQLHGEGDADVPALDARLAGVWQNARRPATAAERTMAIQRRLAQFYGDLGRTTARIAAAPFVPALPSDAVLVALPLEELNAALAALPAWETLPRFARGAAPAPPPPKKGGVRKSTPPAR
jgi:hypothetical protein